MLAGLGIPFEVRVIQDIDEHVPADLPASEAALYIAKRKAEAYQGQIADDELIITADTVVIVGDEILGKPADEADALRMLRMLSGRTHQVTTGVCLMTTKMQRSFDVTTDVTFKSLTDEEIMYYVRRYKPFDKAGAYGIQEWIGYIGVTGLHGSYYNVMGLPVQRIYTELQAFGLSAITISQKRFCPLKIFWGVDANGLDISQSDTDAIAVLKPSQLFEALCALQAALRQLGDLSEYFAAIGIDAQVLEEGVLAKPFAGLDASDIGDDAATEVKGESTDIGDYLWRVGIHDAIETLKGFAEGADLCRGIVEEVHQCLHL